MRFPDLPLTTTRLRLRPLEAGDAPALFQILSDRETLRYWSAPPWTSMDEAHAYVARAATDLAAGSSLRLVLEHRNDGRLIGQCTLYAIDAQNRRAEVGYILRPDAGGQGLMDEALRALLAYGFETLDLIRVEADIDPRNRPSARSLERLGFQLEGTMRQRWIVAGEVSDTGFYGLLREDWRRDRLTLPQAPG